eukprot:TRINITY_DN27855_c0_g1_i1.p1 TRINITY_DN27855_c0_g1~~TRINITY_DN27855_c0_g1_i1.p1  ORF type:complete len:616 (-),score=60.77 TRINITY_DN27855_c0_g1_i1:68-1915(-)
MHDAVGSLRPSSGTRSNAHTYGPPVVMGDESLMCEKAHGSSAVPVQEDLRWGCDPLMADDIGNFNRHVAEPRGYWLKTTFLTEASALKPYRVMRFYDSNTGCLLFTVSSTSGRKLDAFLSESKVHGWPSFRDDEVNWDRVRILPGGEVVSIDGTHLGHNIPDKKNRYCINLVCVAGHKRARCCPWARPFQRLYRKHLPPSDPANHYVLRDNRMREPFPIGYSVCAFAAGCFWGAEKGFWRLPGVYSTAVGFCGGHDFATNPSYMYVTTGDSGHAEAVQVVWDIDRISFADLLRHFWNCHDPTQGNRQGADKGSPYRSGIYCTNDVQAAAARASLRGFDATLRKVGGFSSITTEVRVGCPFWFAEPHHQQYLAKPGSTQYCSAEPTGIEVPPYESWDWDPEDTGGADSQMGRQSLQPKLPALFWEVYDISISAPNWPEELEERQLVQAAEKIRDRNAAQAAVTSSIESQHFIIVQHCTSCGYKRRAVELAAYLQLTCGVRVGLVHDVFTTGAFVVKIKMSNGSLRVVHSKRGGDGFVDTAEKVERIIRAIIEADPDGEAARSAETTLASASNFSGIADIERVGSIVQAAKVNARPSLPASSLPDQPPSSVKPAFRG